MCLFWSELISSLDTRQFKDRSLGAIRQSLAHLVSWSALIFIPPPTPLHHCLNCWLTVAFALHTKVITMITEGDWGVLFQDDEITLKRIINWPTQFPLQTDYISRRLCVHLIVRVVLMITTESITTTWLAWRFFKDFYEGHFSHVCVSISCLYRVFSWKCLHFCQLSVLCWLWLCLCCQHSALRHSPLSTGARVWMITSELWR